MAKRGKFMNRISRRDFLRYAALAAGGTALAACPGPEVAPEDTPVPDVEVPEEVGPAWATAPTVSRPGELRFVYWPWGTTEDELVERFRGEWEVEVDQLIEPNVEEVYARVNTMYATGEQVDVIKTLINWLGEWAENEVLQPIDGLAGLEDYKADMNNLALQCVEWQGQTWGLPYYQSFFTAAFFEDHFEEGGIESPPTSYDELVDQALKLKTDGVSEYPILWMAAQGAEHVMVEYYQLVHNWGGTVFDADMEPTLGPGSVAREALDWWQRTFTEWEISAPESLELRYIPAARAFWTGQYSYHMFTHHYYFSLMNSEEESPIQGRVHAWFLPNDGATLGWTALYCMGATTANPEWAWMLLQNVGGKTRDGEYTIAKQYAIGAMLGSGFDVVNRDPEVMEAWSKWIDVDLNLRQWEQATAHHLAVPAMLAPWYQRWQDSAQVPIQNCLLGEISADEACDEMIALHQRLAG